MTHSWDDFDCALTNSLTQLPPQEESIREITPWRQAMRRVITGLVLTSFTFNFWYLQQILPAVGVLQMYLGFRTLRSNNCWFRISWLISICKVILLFISYLLSATTCTQFLFLPRTVLSCGLTMLLFLTLRQGLRQAAGEVNQVPSRDPGLWAALWYGVVLVLALWLPQIGWLGFIPVFLAFIAIIRALIRVSEELDLWGYAIRAAPVHLSAKQLYCLFFSLLLILILPMSIASSHLSVDASPVPQQESASEIAEIQSHLEQLGMPEDLIRRLPEDELLELKTADLCFVNPDSRATSQDIGVRFDDVQIRIAPQTFRCYHFFRPENNTFRNTLQNYIALSPDSSDEDIQNIKAQISWKHKTAFMYADIPLTPQRIISYFGDVQQTHEGTFSYPFFSEEPQGWAAYTIRFPTDQIGASSILTYRLQEIGALYPYPVIENSVDNILQIPGDQCQSYSSYFWG